MVLMAKNKSNLARFCGKSIRFGYLSVKSLTKLILIDSFVIVKDSYKHARYPETKDRLDRKLDSEKKLTLHENKIKRLERLIYSIYNDPSYSKSDKGKDDLKELKLVLKDELH